MPTRSHPKPSLEKLVAALPSSLCPLEGARAGDLRVPENVACFQRSRAKELNLPNHGRTLHHRFVLIAALRGTVTACVDDREIVLHGGEGLLIFPFQFHNYLEAPREAIRWLIVTFESVDLAAVEHLRFRPFVLTPELRAAFIELLVANGHREEPRLIVLLLALLLTRLRSAKTVRPRQEPAAAGSIVAQVNLIAERSPQHLVVKELAKKLGISPSHLRARFLASCGVSLGRHLRRLRLEKACGFLRLGTSRVSDIAESCKFTSIYSFSRAFQNAYGMSPLAYRRAALHGVSAPGGNGHPRRVRRRPVVIA